MGPICWRGGRGRRMRAAEPPPYIQMDPTYILTAMYIRPTCPIHSAGGGEILQPF